MSKSFIPCCWYCKHLDYSEAISYSILTYQPSDLSCIPGKLFMDGEPTKQVRLDLITIAKKCPYFELLEEIDTNV